VTLIRSIACHKVTLLGNPRTQWRLFYGFHGKSIYKWGDVPWVMSRFAPLLLAVAEPEADHKAAPEAWENLGIDPKKVSKF